MSFQINNDGIGYCIDHSYTIHSLLITPNTAPSYSTRIRGIVCEWPREGKNMAGVSQLAMTRPSPPLIAAINDSVREYQCGTPSH